MWFLQLVIIINFFFIIFQDIKHREVVWFLFPIAGLLMAMMHYIHTEWEPFIINSILNIGIVFVILGILYAYAKFKLQKSFFEETFGLGDALFFIACALGFPLVTFIVLFVFSLVFSLLITLIINKKEAETTVPLAGYMSIFLIAIFCISWIFKSPNLYLL